VPAQKSKTVIPKNGAPVRRNQQVSIQALKQHGTDTTHANQIVNAHTQNLAVEAPLYHEILTNPFRVLGDGTDVRWAERILMRDNLVGTDQVLDLLESNDDHGNRYFILPETRKLLLLRQMPVMVK
jgi:UDP-N-acetyl-D-mannosaminuronic acid transferase (WecB/TagA/CpsF family)